jgi:amino acid adenylation domain-containing protein
MLKNQEAYWQSKLGGEMPAVQIWSDYPRPPISSFLRATESIALEPRLVRQVRTFCARENISEFVTLLAVFNILLHRYTGQDDIIIGSPFSGCVRPKENQNELYFTNLLALRTDLANNPSFGTLLERVGKVAQDATDNRDYAFERVVAQSHSLQKQNGLPIFTTMFALRGVPTGASATAITEDDLVEIEEHANKCDLFLWLCPDNEILTIACQYDAELFEVATIVRLLRHYETLLEASVGSPDLRLSELPILTNAEQAQLLIGWNETASDYPKDKRVYQLIEAQVEKSPDAVAVVYSDQQLTYRELNCRANQLAHRLRRLGVGPDVLVGICLERSLEMVVGLLGILKAGGAYVPLDPAYPRDRLRFVLKDARVKLVLTQQSLAAAMPTHESQMLCLDLEEQTLCKESTENPVSVVSGSDRAYVIYTSGSTGNPKGVEITHNSVVNFLSSMAEQPGMTEQDVLLAVTTVSFDIAGLEIYLPLTVGARVAIVSRDVAADGVRLMHYLDRSHVTVMQATPATWRLLLDAGWQGSNGFKILCGGEALSGELGNQLVKRSESVWNLYGPTETTIWSAIYRVESVDLSVPIGRPIKNTEVYILDRHMRPVPIGVAGELYIGGAGLARGYLNRPELTEEKFIRNPFSDDPSTRLYKTGDLARYLPDGNIQYLNRLDHQIKIRGFRVELGEIEAVLLQHPGVKESVAMLREDQPGDPRVVAYVIAESAILLSTSKLRKFLKDTLPEYMVPSAFVVLDVFPLTPNGKIDRRALPVPDQNEIQRSEEFMAPRTPMEEVLARVWADVLGVERVSVDDNFFDLGGHSFLMSRVQLQLKTQLGQEVSLVDLFRYPTIKMLNEFLDSGSVTQPDQGVGVRAQKQRSVLQMLQRMRTAG